MKKNKSLFKVLRKNITPVIVSLITIVTATMYAMGYFIEMQNIELVNYSQRIDKNLEEYIFKGSLMTLISLLVISLIISQMNLKKITLMKIIYLAVGFFLINMTITSNLYSLFKDKQPEEVLNLNIVYKTKKGNSFFKDIDKYYIGRDYLIVIKGNKKYFINKQEIFKFEREILEK